MNICILAVILIISQSATALDSVRMASGRYIAYDKYIVASDKPTFIFLPGINRGLDSRDIFIQKLKQQKKVNFVSYHSSLHPESLRAQPASETAYFLNQNVSAQDLANEALYLVKKLNIKDPIFVGLSFSSLLTTQLSKSESIHFVIDVAPMIRFDETDPDASQIIIFWKNWLNLFPGFGSFWSKVFLQQAYLKYWTERVSQTEWPDNHHHNNLEEMKKLMALAYTQLSLAADGFDYSQQDFSLHSKKYFILAGKEDQSRLTLQNKVIHEYRAVRNEELTTFILPTAGHIIPTDEPQKYIETLRKILQLENKI